MKRLFLAAWVLGLAAVAAGCGGSGGSGGDAPVELPGPARWDDANWNSGSWE